MVKSTTKRVQQRRLVTGLVEHRSYCLELTQSAFNLYLKTKDKRFYEHAKTFGERSRELKQKITELSRELL